MIAKFNVQNKILALTLGFLLSVSTAKAATSYLMIVGPYGAGNSTSSYQFIVNYDASSNLTTGSDLMTKVLSRLSNSTFTNGYVTDIKINGTNVHAAYPSTNWEYYVAGGAWSNSLDTPSTGNYPTSTWQYARTGISDRSLVDGSFDTWYYSYGSTDTIGDIDGDGYDHDYRPTIFYNQAGSNSGDRPLTINGASPTAAAFTGATVINLSAAPEPSRIMLLVLGLCALGWRRENGERCVK